MLKLPPVLAGPILRRCEYDEETNKVFLNIWIATSFDYKKIQVEIFSTLKGRDQKLPCFQERLKVPCGNRVYINVISIKFLFPIEDLKEKHTVFAYNIFFETIYADKSKLSLADLANIDDFLFNNNFTSKNKPIFSVQLPGSPLNAFYGSCRKPQGDNVDALIGMEKKFLSLANDEGKFLPNALFFTGDQIYADDVHPKLFEIISQLAEVFSTSSEFLMNNQLPGIEPTSNIKKNDELERNRYARKKFLRDAGLTSDSDFFSYHIIEFSEYIAMYILVWNYSIWPKDLQEALPEPYKGAKSIKRLLASIPTYMIFDDHDVTDDFFFDDEWKKTVLESKAGRKIISNALSSYWLFQDWGNRDLKELNNKNFMVAINEYVLKRKRGMFDKVFIEYKEWSFLAPTRPPTIFMNTRTERVSQSSPARLIDEHEYTRLTRLLAGKKPRGKIIFVSPSPIFSFDGIKSNKKRGSDIAKFVKLTNPVLSKLIVERYLSDVLIDFEDFDANPNNLYIFLLYLSKLVNAYKCDDITIISGDVHFSSSGIADIFTDLHDKNSITRFSQFRIIQHTSSPLNNSLSNFSQGKVEDASDDYLARVSEDISNGIAFQMKVNKINEFLIFHNFSFFKAKDEVMYASVKNNYGLLIKDAENKIDKNIVYDSENGKIFESQYS